ncbi:reverse transcriptase [Chromobacterium violaceum]|uniref:Reverse transcriptase n=1 Tax=Chromobacterium violaceum TaxID=536 RepID=A0A202BET6_CHRVL|nr:reverse transcriptase [Chromobacterium violaceum]
MSAAKKFKAIFSPRNLRRLYFDKVIQSGAIGIDRIRPHKLEPVLKAEIDVITSKVHAGTYKFTAFKEKLISKGQSVPPRLISIPTARDRIVLRALCDFLGQVFPEATMALPQVSIDALQGALASGKYAEFIKIDLKNFYPSIPHSIIFNTLKKKIRKPQILALIKASIETPTVPESKGSKGSKPNIIGVPQGLAISNVLAEIALLSIDSHYKSRADIWYSRYVDDILILTPAGAANEIAIQVFTALSSLGLTPHKPGIPGSKSKIAPLSESFNFLGYEINGGFVSIRRESILRFESSLASIFTAYRHKLARARAPEDTVAAIALCQWRLNLRITGCIFEGRRMGWVFYFSQITTTTPLRAVNRTIEVLVRRFGLERVIQPKSLIKVYYESKRKDKISHKYIPNFDSMSADEQRAVLSIVLGASKIKTLTDRRISELFKMRIGAAVRELEADLSGAS